MCKPWKMNLTRRYDKKYFVALKNASKEIIERLNGGQI
jgi:hypothetical protein